VGGHHRVYGQRGEHGGEFELALLHDDPVSLLFGLIWVQTPNKGVREGLTPEKKDQVTTLSFEKLCLCFPFPFFSAFLPDWDG
jgi:hypothetical protein